MARSKTDTVEYFPHVAKPGKTLYILEGQFGNDGYAFWFKLLEVLSSSEGHFYDASTEIGWNYLIAYTKVPPQSATEILLLLANLENIDLDLWKNHRILWCQALINNLTEVYRKRKRELPQKPICDDNANYCANNAEKGGFKHISATSRRQSATKIPQSKVKKRKEKKTIKDIGAGEPAPLSISPLLLADLWNTKAPPECPRVDLPFKRNDKDMAKIKNSLKRNPDPKWWERLIIELFNLPFVRGENDRGWVITLDVMVRDAEKIMDGKYSGGPKRIPKSLEGLREYARRKDA